MTPNAPRQYVVRKPSGDPDAARRLAEAYDALADSVTAQARIVLRVLDQLAWHGLGARAVAPPEQVLQAAATHVSRALHESADNLRHYAHKLQRAHEHHGWSIGKLVAVGALVTVGAAAIVVTVGAAAPAEAAAATAAIEGAEAATAAAETAGSTAAAELSAWQALLGAVKPLAPFVVPHLISAGASVGFDAVSELLTDQKLDAHSLEVAAVVGFTGSAATGAVETKIAKAPDVVRRLVEGGTWAGGGTVGEYADEGQVDPADSAAFGLTGFVARDVRRLVDKSVRSAPQSHPRAEQP
ncbi:MAG TPA: hypothetical protein VFH54_17105 [Mycobacteriales bacterium]|nr:hypothetical protein [Mycobacteriales bacterium]